MLPTSGRRRLAPEVDEKYDYKDMERILEKAKMVPLAVVDPQTGGTYYGWQEGVYENFSPDQDFVGRSFKPFGSHNYLYGMPVRKMLLGFFRIMHDPSHPEHKEMVKEIEEMYEDMRKEGLQPLTVPGAIAYYEKKGPTILVISACEYLKMKVDSRVFLYHKFLSYQDIFFTLTSQIAYYSAPAMVGTQLWTLGWKRTLWLWAVGVLMTEGATYQMRQQDVQVSGWSLITYMIFGQFMNEAWSDRKKLFTWNKGLFEFRGALIHSMWTYGAWETGSSFYMDPAPPGQAGKKTGTHHGIHHLGLITGWLLNRWTR